MKSTLNSGQGINLINGSTLVFGNEILYNLFKLINSKTFFVISIIGPQSSAKSTLMNYLFGCGFDTSSVRCTKGLYISIMNHERLGKILILDTEGLMTLTARDPIFDKQICTFAFSISNIVIINMKGQINNKIKDLLEVCLYAMKVFQFSERKPTLLWALRDMISDKTNLLEEKNLQADTVRELRESLESTIKTRGLEMNNIIDIKPENVFIFPPAFNNIIKEDEVNILNYNSEFSDQVLKLREFIFS